MSEFWYPAIYLKLLRINQKSVMGIEHLILKWKTKLGSSNPIYVILLNNVFR